MRITSVITPDDDCSSMEVVVISRDSMKKSAQTIGQIHGVEKLFAGLVFRMLLKENMISKELVDNMRNWKHSGFSVHRGKPINADDPDGRKVLSEYISRAPFSLERMSFNEGSKTVVCKGEHFHPTLARNFDVAGPLEWIARITSHIPKKGAKQVIYYGAYSQAWRGRERRRKQMWAALLKEVWDVDALKCPKCGGRMKVISFIEQPSVIRRILKHLDLWEDSNLQSYRRCGG